MLSLVAAIVLTVITFNNTYETSSKQQVINPRLNNLRLKYFPEHSTEVKSFNSSNRTILSDNCQNLFTVGRPLSYTKQISDKNSLLRYNIEKLESVRDGKFDLSYTATLKEFTRMMEQKFRTKNYVQNKNLSLNSGYVTEAKTELPFVGCKEAWYSNHDHKRCLSMIKHEKRRPLNIVFFGDSRARFLMKYVLQTFEPILNASDADKLVLERFYSKKIHTDISMDFSLLNVSLKWTPYLDEEEDKLRLLNQWCHPTRMEPNLPDLLVMSSGPWSSTHRNHIAGLGDFYDALELIVPCLSLISQKTQVLWLIQPPMKVKYMI